MRDIIDHRYRVEAKLAAGGFGAIYQATDLSIGRQVALKVLHRELAGDPSVVARFRREAAVLAKLKSPHTLTVYDVGQTDDTLYFVMELLRGESLEQVFEREGRLPWQRVAAIMRGVCNSLLEAHDIGLIHRDLKPANIFLETHALSSDFAKVLDFGIAKVLETSALENQELTRHGQTVGTIDYMAPEQMIGGRCTFKSDVFTLGIVMYEMIAGERPYGEAQSAPQMVMALLSTLPAPLDRWHVPVELGSMIMRCIAREPDQRPSVAEVDSMLERVLWTASSSSNLARPNVETEPVAVQDLDALDAPTVLEPLRPIEDAIEGRSPVARPTPSPAARSTPSPAARSTPRHAARPTPTPRTTLTHGSATPLHVAGAMAREAIERAATIGPIDDPLETASTVLVRDDKTPAAFAVGTSPSQRRAATQSRVPSPDARTLVPSSSSSQGPAVPVMSIPRADFARPVHAVRIVVAAPVAPSGMRPALIPVPQPGAKPIAAAKGRLASGTTPPGGTPVVHKRTSTEDSASVMLMRAAAIALCLFSLGFVIALAVLTL